MNDMIQLIRPKHWVKNIVVLLPIVFGSKMTDAMAWTHGITAVISFCLLSSFGYIINDIRDARSDREHPHKKNRPLASDRISIKTAISVAAGLFVVGCFIAYAVSVVFLVIVLGYAVLELGYSFVLKNKAILDVICIAMGFVLRAASGAVAIGVAISPWLFICMFTLCLFMGFCKRYNEIVTIGDVVRAGSHRPTLIDYTPELLTHLITVSAGIAVIAFLMYSLSDRTVMQFGTNYFIYTMPVVVYAVFRFAMLSMKGAYTDPTDLILRDRPFQFTVVVWIVSCVVIIRWGIRLSEWVRTLY